MAKEFEVIHRFIVSVSDLEVIESQVIRLDDPVYVGGTCADRCLLKGVPAKRIDLTIAHEREFNGVRHEELLCEIGWKLGRFDGAKRLRITFRPVLGSNWKCPRGTIRIISVEGCWEILAAGPGIYFLERFERLVSDLDRYKDLGAIVIWHWSRFYQVPIPFEDAQALASGFEAEFGHLRSTSDLNTMNRLASRKLYELANDLGWRKLTEKQRKRIGLEVCGCWVHENDLLGTQYGNREGNGGVGDYTLESANNGQCIQTSRSCNKRVEITGD